MGTNIVGNIRREFNDPYLRWDLPLIKTPTPDEKEGNEEEQKKETKEKTGREKTKVRESKHKTRTPTRYNTQKENGSIWSTQRTCSIKFPERHEEIKYRKCLIFKGKVHSKIIFRKDYL